jgi:hypothetical protein
MSIRKIVAYITGGIGIVAVIISFWDFNLAIDILVKAIIIGCFVELLLSIPRMLSNR